LSLPMIKLGSSFGLIAVSLSSANNSAHFEGHL